MAPQHLPASAGLFSSDAGERIGHDRPSTWSVPRLGIELVNVVSAPRFYGGNGSLFLSCTILALVAIRDSPAGIVRAQLSSHEGPWVRMRSARIKKKKKKKT